MKKYHISIHDEVVQCPAESPASCRRRKVSLHFDTREQGEEFLEEKYRQQYGSLPSQSQQSVQPKFTIPESVQQNPKTASACKKFYAAGINVSFHTTAEDLFATNTSHNSAASNIDVVTDDFTVHQEDIFARGNPLKV